MELFIDTYLGEHRGTPLRVADVGSQVVTEGHATYRTLFEAAGWAYVGLDVEAGHNVDAVLGDPYRWSDVPAESFDVVISGQALEHIPYFWLTAFEIVRVLKPGGITMLIAPSGGFEHRFPVDCWRFYRDGMVALAELVNCEVLDAHTSWPAVPWSDSVLVMRRPHLDVGAHAALAARRDAQYLACFGRQPTADWAPATPSASPLSAAQPDRLAPRLVAAFAPPAPTPPAPAPSPAWKTAARRLLGERGLAVYRAARYGRSHAA